MLFQHCYILLSDFQCKKAHWFKKSWRGREKIPSCLQSLFVYIVTLWPHTNSSQMFLLFLPLFCQLCLSFNGQRLAYYNKAWKSVRWSHNFHLETDIVKILDRIFLSGDFYTHKVIYDSSANLRQNSHKPKIGPCY